MSWQQVMKLEWSSFSGTYVPTSNSASLILPHCAS